MIGVLKLAADLGRGDDDVPLSVAVAPGPAAKNLPKRASPAML
jgi:hypothetical protein